MSKYCPNLNNHEVTKQFTELSHIFDRPTAYQIWFMNNGHAFDINDDGSINEEFKQLEQQLGRIEAIKQYWKQIQIVNSTVANNKNIQQSYNRLQQLFETISRFNMSLKEFNTRYGTNLQWADATKTRLRYNTNLKLYGVPVLNIHDKRIETNQPAIDRSKLLQYLQQKFNLNYQILSDVQYQQYVADNNSNCFVVGNTVYFRQSRLNRLNNEQFIEEFLHPTVHDLYNSNQKLTQQLLREAQITFPDLCKQIQALYKIEAEQWGQQVIDEEIITQVLSKYLNQEITDNGTNTRNILKYIKVFFQAIFDKFKDLFGDIDTLQIENGKIVAHGRDIRDVFSYQHFAQLINSKQITFQDVLSKNVLRNNKGIFDMYEAAKQGDINPLLQHLDENDYTIKDKVNILERVLPNLPIREWYNIKEKVVIEPVEDNLNRALTTLSGYLDRGINFESFVKGLIARNDTSTFNKKDPYVTILRNNYSIFKSVKQGTATFAEVADAMQRAYRDGNDESDNLGADLLRDAVDECKTLTDLKNLIVGKTIQLTKSEQRFDNMIAHLTTTLQEEQDAKAEAAYWEAQQQLYVQTSTDILARQMADDWSDEDFVKQFYPESLNETTDTTKTVDLTSTIRNFLGTLSAYIESAFYVENSNEHYIQIQNSVEDLRVPTPEKALDFITETLMPLMQQINTQMPYKDNAHPSNNENYHMDAQALQQQWEQLKTVFNNHLNQIEIVEKLVVPQTEVLTQAEREFQNPTNTLRQQQLDTVDYLFATQQTESQMRLQSIAKKTFQECYPQDATLAQHHQQFHDLLKQGVPVNEIADGYYNMITILLNDLVSTQPIYQLDLIYPNIFSKKVLFNGSEQEVIDIIRQIAKQRPSDFAKYIFKYVDAQDFLDIVYDTIINNYVTDEIRQQLTSLHPSKFQDCYLDLINSRLQQTFNFKFTNSNGEVVVKTDELEFLFIPKDQRTVPFLQNLDTVLKNQLNQIAKIDPLTHLPMYNQFGLPEMYGYSVLSNKLVALLHNCRSSNEMMSKLAHCPLPFVNQIIEMCKNHTEFQQLLFSNMCKSKNLYFTLTTRNEHNLKLTNLDPLNDIFAVQQHLLSSAVKSGTKQHALFEFDSYQNSRDVRININEAQNLLNDLVNPLIDVLNQQPQVVENDTLNQLLQQIYPKIQQLIIRLGLPSISFYELQMLVAQGVQDDYTSYKLTGLQDLLLTSKQLLGTILNEQQKLTDNNPFDIKSLHLLNKFNDLAGLLNPYRLESRDTVVWANKKQYPIYTPINYIQKVVQQLQKNAKQFIENNYANTILFKRFWQKDHNGQIMHDNNGDMIFAKNGHNWITDLYFNPNARMFEFNTFLSHDKTDYFSMTKTQYIRTVLKTFFSDRNNGLLSKAKMTRYMLPVLADKSTTGTITWRKYSFDELMGSKINPGGRFATLMEQELDRMQNVYARALKLKGKNLINGYDITLDEQNQIVNLNTKGIKFYFTPGFNGLLSQIHDAQACVTNPLIGYIHDRIYNTNTYLTAYTQDGYSINEAIQTIIRNFFTNAFNDWFHNLTDQSDLQDLLGFDNQKDFELEMRSFYINQYYANTQIFQLLTNDLCYYKHTDDIQKRIAEFISPGMAHDVDSLSQNTKRIVIVADDKRAETTQNGINDILQRAYDKSVQCIKTNPNLSAQQQEQYINDLKQKLNRNQAVYSQGKLDGTDGQGFVSLDYTYKALKSLGQHATFEPLYQELKRLLQMYGNKQMTKQELLHGYHVALKRYGQNFTQEVRKQFTYSQLLLEDNINDGSFIKRGFQIKNAEQSLMDWEMMIRSSDSTLLDMLVFLDQNNLDALYFQSNCKVGLNGMLSSKNLNSQKFFEYATNTINQDPLNYIYEVNMTDVVEQQKTPKHYVDCECNLGIQVRKLIHDVIVDQMPTTHGQTESVMINGTTASKLRMEFEHLLEHKVALNTIKLYKDLGLNPKLRQKILQHQPLTHTEQLQVNLQFSNLLRKELNANNNTNLDELYGFELNEAGNFNIATAEPMQFQKINKVLIKLLKKTILDCNTNGGQLVQVTDDFRLDAIDKTKGTDLAQSLELSDELRIAYYDKDNQITYDPAKAVRVAYFECEMPPYSQKLIDAYGDENGYIDMKNVPSELLEIIGYRIPTEGLCSMFPIKIKRFSTLIGGGIIKLPRVITAIGGMDFDIDKLFFGAPSFSVDESNPNILQFDRYDLNNITAMSMGQVNNAILHHIRTVLTHPVALAHQFTPSNFAEITHMSHLCTAFNAWRNTQSQITASQAVMKYQELEQMNENELESIVNQVNGNRNINDFATQVYLFNRNSQSTAEIAICANGSALHSFLKHYQIPVHFNSATFTINDYRLDGQSTILDPIYLKDGVTMVSQNIRQFLAAAVDGVKCPDLEGINFTTFTINIGLTMLRLGFDIPTVALVLQQPIVKQLQTIYDTEVQEMAKNNELGRPNIQNVIKQVRQLLPNYKSTSSNNVHISKKDLIVGMAHRNLQGSPNFTMIQYDLSVFCANMLTLSEELMSVGKILKVDTKTTTRYQNLFELWTAEDSFDRYLERNRIQSTLLDSKFSNLFEPTSQSFSPMLSSYRDATKHISQVFTDVVNPLAASYREIVLPAFQATLSQRISGKHLDLVFNDYMLYLISNRTQGFLPQTQASLTYYTQTFPVKAMHFRNQLLQNAKYQTNSFLLNLQTDSTIDQKSNYLCIDSLGLSKDDTQRLTQDWQTLLLDSDNTVVTFARELFLYDMMRNGFKFDNKAFGYLFPKSIKATMLNYNEFWQSCQPIQIGELSDFIDLCVRNNPQITKLVKDPFKLIQQHDTSDMHVNLPLYVHTRDENAIVLYKRTDDMTSYEPITTLSTFGGMKNYINAELINENTMMVDDDVTTQTNEDQDVEINAISSTKQPTTTAVNPATLLTSQANQRLGVQGSQNIQNSINANQPNIC